MLLWRLWRVRVRSVDVRRDAIGLGLRWLLRWSLLLRIGRLLLGLLLGLHVRWLTGMGMGRRGMSGRVRSRWELPRLLRRLEDVLLPRLSIRIELGMRQARWTRLEAIRQTRDLSHALRLFWNGMCVERSHSR